MRVLSVSLRNFRSYEAAAAPLGGGLTVLWGPNGAGKTNLLDGLYLGCTGRSCRTTSDRELIRFGSEASRVAVVCEDDSGLHELAVGLSAGEPKRMSVDGAPVERLLDSPMRPLVSVFLPDRLELVKGVPAARRAHLDQVVAALWPARVVNRRAYAQALAQRNALVSRIRAGLASHASLEAWDASLAEAGIALMRDRRAAVELLCGAFQDLCSYLCLDGEAAIAYRPRSRAESPAQLAQELSERAAGDVERGYTEHGPHRDELSITLDRRPLRTYGSQGQQRLALLALLLTERQVLAEHRPGMPLMLLDDVMSELDRSRRGALVDLLTQSRGQAVITTTDLEQVPRALASSVARLVVADGGVGEDVAARSLRQ